ncbi:MAG TPA: T9SS type A sorting domain-containing protein [Flavobacteriales bacterium]|nr:T9SS type A sorting domain-containing protein [Flavobacteriales bacterium]
MAFEDGTGARDTIWMVYDTTATLGPNPWPGPNVDTLLGEGFVNVNDGLFHVFRTNAVGDTTQTNAFPYTEFPNFDGTIIDAINWVPPMTIRWDTSLFHAPYLPYDQGHIGLAVMNGLAFSQFNDGSLDFGLVSMLNRDSINIGFLWDYLFPFGVLFDAENDLEVSSTNTHDRLLRVWPNPATEVIRVGLEPGYVKSLVITDLLGHTWFREAGTRLVQPLNITPLPPGRYFIHVRSNNHIHHGTFEKIH